MGEDNTFTMTFTSIDGREYKMNGNDIKEYKDEAFDPVNKPRHYNREGAMECIDEMILIYGEEATMYYCLLNCHKYRYRAGLKNDGYQDLEKSDWYMRKYKELKDKINSTKCTTNSAPETITIPYTPPWTINPTWTGTPTWTCTFSGTDSGGNNE